jgi:hypothetical protein
MGVPIIGDVTLRILKEHLALAQGDNLGEKRPICGLIGAIPQVEFMKRGRRRSIPTSRQRLDCGYLPSKTLP